MAEACRHTQVPPYTLRYWERALGFPRPARRASGHRRYSRGDLEPIGEIKQLLEGRRMTLSGARRALLERRRGISPAPGTSASPQTLRILREARAELREIVSELAKC